MVPDTPLERAKLLKKRGGIEEFGLEARKEVQEQTLVGQKVIKLLALIVVQIAHFANLILGLVAWKVN